MRIMNWVAGAAMVLLAAAGTAGAQSDDLKAFPVAEPGMQRMVIRMRAVPAPEDRRVEVMIGKTIEVDCNRHAFATSVTRNVAPGWGFTFYVVGELKGPVSTQMACPPGFVTRREFVCAHTDELAWLPYNPRLPIVLYVPAGTEVRYRIWIAGDTAEDARAE